MKGWVNELSDVWETL